MLTNNGGFQARVPAREMVDFDPEWFRAALAEQPQSHRVAFGDSHMHYFFWQHKETRGKKEGVPLNLVLLHGDGAHAHWFDFVAPLLTPYYNVMAVDLPGMGDSGWQKKYSREIMAEAVACAIKDAPFTSRPALIAHSFGGFIGLQLAHAFSHDIAALMICDFHTRPPQEHHEWYADYKARPHQYYKDRNELMARFRLRPEQACINQFILDHIASHSIIEEKAGWRWKFDPAIYEGFEIGQQTMQIYKNLSVPLAAMFGELGIEYDTMTRREMVAHMRALRPDCVHFDIIGAHHHVMLDQPFAFATACHNQMEQWRAQKIFD